MSAITNALKKALDLDPSNWETRHALIEAYVTDDQKAEARALLDNIDALPEDESSLIAAGLSYALVGSPGDGRGIIKHVLDHNPGNADAHLAMASIAHEENDKRTAMRHYLTATGINPSLSSRELDAAYGGVLDGISSSENEAAKPKAETVTEAKAATVAEEEPESPPLALAALAAPEITPEPEPELTEAASVEQPEPEPEVSTPVEVVAEAEEEEEEPIPVVAAVDVIPEEEEEEEPAPAPTAKAAPPLLVAQEKKAEESGTETIKLIDAGRSPSTIKAATLVSLVKVAEKDTDAEAETEAGAPVELLDEDYDDDVFDSEHIKHWCEEAEAERRRTAARDKLTSLTVTILLHAAVFLFLGLVIIAVPRDAPPQIIASATSADSPEDIQQETIQKNQIKPSSAASAATEIVSATAFSSIALANVEAADMGATSAFSVDFQPSMSFGDAPSSVDSKMMFGQKMDGEVLGVILDVSGSMAEYLPAVVREVDANFKNAPIVYVNHAGILGGTDDCEIYPIIAEEVIPYWNDETGRRHHSPFWFLWGDLPRKAEQRYVDRLIDTFKKRPNMFIARGGRNRIGSATEFLMTQGIDSLYIFSDFEDFVDETYCEELGKRLGRGKIKTYVQPAAARTEHLAIMARRVAGRSMGRELPPLTELLRPGDTEPAPIAVAEKKAPTPVPDGVKFATPRAETIAPGVYHFNYWGGGSAADHKTRFKDILKVVEYPNFDVVIRGPEARAYIYMKTKEGYIQNPVVFGYHSRKPYVSEKDGKTYYRWRKWLRNEEEPHMDGDEFTWKMVLEDEIKFEVKFWFKADTLTGTYAAEYPPEGQSDYAHIYFVVPPMARESRDMYVGLDFPKGLSLEDLRLAMTDNVATFYLPVQAQDSLGTAWSRLGFKKGENRCSYNILYRDLPSGVREVTVSGPSFGPRKLEARTTSNDLLLSTGNRADMELWEGFACRLVRPNDRREGIRKTEAIAFKIE